MSGNIQDNLQLNGVMQSNLNLSGSLSGGASVSYTAGDGIDITDNVISNTITSYNDLTDTPEPLQTITRSGTFTYKNKTFNYETNTFGNFVSMSIYMNDFAQTHTPTSTVMLLTTFSNEYWPTFEVVAPVMGFGMMVGTCWLDPNGELSMILTKNNEGIFRINLNFVKS